LLLTQDIASEGPEGTVKRESAGYSAAVLATPLCPQHEHHRLRLLLGIARAAAVNDLKPLKVASLYRRLVHYEALAVAHKKIDHALLFAAMSEAETKAFLEAEHAQMEVDEAQLVKHDARTLPQREALDMRVERIDAYLRLKDAQLVGCKQEIEAFLQVSSGSHTRGLRAHDIAMQQQRQSTPSSC
jgi:hypothetical protein